MSKIPNFLCIGAQKAGTTSIHDVFSHHPGIFVPVVSKEPHFFDNEADFLTGYDLYLQNFFAEAGQETAVGEFTPSYLPCRAARDRIFETLGENLKLIVVLRHPVQRAISHYRMNLNWMWETDSFEQAIAGESGKTAGHESLLLRFGYLARGRYLEQIRHYMERFPRENFHFILFEELLQEYNKVLPKCFRFLGVQELAIDGLPVSNKSEKVQITPVKEETVIKLMIRNSAKDINVPANSYIVNKDFWGNVRIFKSPPERLAKKLDRVIELLEQDYPTAQRQQEIYQQYFKEDEQELADLTGLDLARWWS